MPPERGRQRSSSSEDGQVASLLAILDAAYDHPSWHGPNLRGSLRGVSPAEAAWRPASNRHNIWELLVHAAYWKYVGLRRLTRAARGSFVYKGSNWFTRPGGSGSVASGFSRKDPGSASWKADLAVLEETHQALRAAVTALPAARLGERPAGSRVTNFALISGLAAHDVYHAGQIQLLKRLCRDRIHRS